MLARPPGEDRLRTGPPSSCLSLPGCELNQEKRTWTFKPQKEEKQDCKVLLNTVGAPQPQGGQEGLKLLGRSGESDPYRCIKVSLLCPRVGTLVRPLRFAWGRKSKGR